MSISINAAQTAQVKDWMTRMEGVPKVITAGWAKDILDAFEAAGIKKAADVTEQKLGAATKAMGKTVDGLLGAMTKQCPVGMKLPSLFATK